MPLNYSVRCECCGKFAKKEDLTLNFSLIKIYYCGPQLVSYLTIHNHLLIIRGVGFCGRPPWFQVSQGRWLLATPPGFSASRRRCRACVAGSKWYSLFHIIIRIFIFILTLTLTPNSPSQNTQSHHYSSLKLTPSQKPLKFLHPILLHADPPPISLMSTFEDITHRFGGELSHVALIPAAARCGRSTGGRPSLNNQQTHQ